MSRKEWFRALNRYAVLQCVKGYRSVNRHHLAYLCIKHRGSQISQSDEAEKIAHFESLFPHHRRLARREYM